MNKTYKVIYNRTRCMYQVVSELAKGHTKSETPEMLKSLFNKHSGLTRGIVMAVLSMSLAMPVGVAVQADGTSDTAANVDLSNLTAAGKKVITDNASATVTSSIGTLSKDGNYIKIADLVSSNLSTLDTQVKANADAISKEKTDRETAVTNVTNTVSTLSDSAVKYDTDSNKGKVTLAGGGGTTITNVKDGVLSDSSTDAVTGKQLYAEQTARTGADTDLSNRIGTLDTQIQTNDSNIKALQTSTTNSLATKADVNASNLASLSDEELTAWGSALGKNGSISKDSSRLITGGTIYNELTPTGTVYYIGSADTTAARLTTLDNTLKTFADQLGVDLSSNTNLANLLYKYYKVNPEITTNADTTKTYAPDAVANGKNSVAIGPSAQAGDKSTDATTSTTTVTGGTSSTAIGDSAKANGDQSVALGYGSEVLNASGSTTAVSGSTAIGNGAKVKGGSDSTALGSGATVDTASGAMALGTGATINKTAASGVAIGNGAVTGSADKTITVNNLSYDVKAAGGENSVAIGTDASNAGNTSLALGKGATVENDSDGNYQAVVKSDDIAIGTDAKTSASDFSTAIGKSATVSQSTDAMAIGSSATVGASSNDAMALGKGATVGSGATDSIAVGTSAKTISADTIAIGQNASATGANSVVIGKGATTTSEGGNAIGLSSTASGNSTAIGQSATANNYNAVAIGNGATANADKSIALGYKAGVGTSEGKGETQNAGSLIAIGTSAGNNVLGMQNVAIGESAGSNVKSSFNVAIGSQAGYGINYASDNKSQNGYNVSIGYKANYQENSADIMYSTALGNEANASNYAVAIGDEAKASGTNSLALGYSAKASDAESMALGHNASAANGNVAIGNGSSAPAVSTLGTIQAVTVDGKTVNYVYDANGNQFRSAFTYKPLQADSHYISVGNSTLTRRISNVADGVFASDAATVGQLNSLNELLQATDTKVGLTKDYFEQKFTDLNTTIDASKTHYFSISESSDNLSANKDNTGATSNKADAMAIGPNANATNVKSLAVGNNVYATGLRSIAIGTAPNPTKDAAGTTTTHNTSAEGENSIALGTSTTAQADNSVAIGTRAQAYTTDTDSGKTGARSVAIGNLATTAGDESVALGYQATVKYNYGTAIGKESLASGVDAVAIGKGSKAYSKDSMAIGQDNSIIGDNVYGLGSSNNFSGDWGAIIQSGVSGYHNTVTSVSDQDTTNALTGIYMTGNINDLNQQNKYNVVQDITVQGTNNKIYGGSNISAGHPNTLSQIAIVGSGNKVYGKSDDDGRTNNIENVTILGYNNKVDANTDTTVDFSNTQILGNNVMATLGNSVYLGNKAAYVQPTSPASDAITAARTAADTAAEASDEYKAAATDEAKVQIKAEYEAKYLYKLRVQAMEGKGTTAGMNSYDTDETYGNGTSYTYAGSNPIGVITVGSVGSERRIQNVAAGLVSATSTDAVNGSQLYALTRQIRFGGDNSSFGKTTAADDQNVVARGSNEAISITGGSDAVTSSTADGTTTYTVDTAKLTDNNIAVVADTDKNALHVQLASNLKNLNTAQLGSGSGESYKETIKLDGTGTNGGQMTLAGADGTVKTTLDTTGLTIANGPKFTSSGIDAAKQQIHNVTAGTDDADAVNVKQLQSARTLLTQGTNTTLADTDADGHHTYTVNVDNLAVKANGTGTTVALANGINFKNGTNTTSDVDSNGNVTIDTKNLNLKANGTNTATVTMDNGINFKNGTNTTATVGTDGTVTISASHNKLDSASYTASKPSDSSNQTTVKLKDTDNNETTLNLTDTYTNVSKNTDHTITFKRNDGSTPVSISLDDLNGASKKALTTAAAKATTTVIQGNNVDRVEDDTTSADGHHIYKINVSNLGVKVADGQKKSVALSEGLVFGNGTNTTASVGDNGAITFNVSDAAIKTQAKDALDVVKGNDNVSVDTTTSPDGTKKTFTISAKDTYTTVTKDADHKTVTFTRNDGDSQTVSLSDLGGITAAQDKYVTGGKVTYNDKGDGTAALTGNNGLAASITGLKDTKVSSGTASYVGTQGDASGSATLTMNDGTKATISGLKDDYITSAAVGTENNHVTMTRLGGGTVDLNLNPILEKYSLSDYHLVGDGTTHDQAYAVDSNGTVTLNVVDDKNSNGTPKTIQITGLASQSDVDAGWTIKGKDSTNADVNANIGKGKSVTYSNGNYTKAVVTKDDSGNATVTVDVTTGTLTTGTDGKITSADGLATTGAVASAVNGASWTIQDGSHTDNAQQVKAGDTVSFKAGDNLTLDQDGREFTYKLNQTLTNMTSVTAVDDKQNTAVLNGEGLKVTDAQGNALTQHATEVRLHDANKAADDTTTDVVLNKQGLQNGGHTITGVADGKVVAGSQEAVNGGQLYDLQQKVGSGWKITGNNTDSTTSIGADKTVSFVNGKNSTVTVSGSDSGATVKVDVDTATLAVKDSRAVATGSGVADASQVAEAINNAAWTVEKAGSEAQAQKVKTGTTVTFGNDENLTLAQNGTAFTYGLASNVNISTIRLGGTKGADDVWTGSIYIGKQMGGGANSNDGNYITGLDNTAWDLSKVVDNRAATEGQLKAAINQVTIASQSGGFGLRDEKGSTVSQMLGQTVGIIGDTEYEADGKTVKQQGNITTEADSTNAGAVKVKLNKNLDLTEQGSVTMGTTTLTSGQAKVGQITVNGTDNTVSGLANTSWDEATAKADGYKGSTKAATESQLQAVYTQATTTASANEQHIQAGTYDVMTQFDANGKKQNSVTMNIVDGSGNTKGQVVINDVAKASDLGDTTALNSDIQNKNGSTSVVDAVNNLNGKVGDNQYLAVTGKEIQNGDSSTTAIGKLNNRMNDIYSKATQHSTVTKADDNVTIQTSTNADGGTNYQIGLNKENIDLGKVTIQGNEGSITAKSMTADTFTAGNTVVNNEGVKIGDKSALTSDTLKVNGKTYVSGDGLNANSQKITNVADGSADTDAVNVKQVNDLAARQGEAIAENAAHIGELGRAVNKLDNRLNRVGAGAAALAALHPGTYDPNDKWDFSAGIGHYHDANAVAIGAYYHPNDTTILSIGGSMGGGENMVNAGITWKMGRSGHEQRAAQPVVTHLVQAAPVVQQAAPARPAPVATPAPVVTPAPVTTPVPVKAVVPATPAPAVTTAMTAAPSGDTAALTQILARQTAILEKLAQNQSQAARPAAAHGDDIFPDVPDNHWAYAYVAKLEKAGALKGFKRPAVLKSPMMTRDDFASVLYTAMANGATTNPALNGDDSLNRLAQEFKAELKDVKP